MTSLEILAYLVVPTFTVAMAAAGYLVLRITTTGPEPDPFYYPIFKYDSSSEFSCISPRLKRQIYSVFPAEIATSVEGDIEQVLHDTLELTPDGFFKTLKAFQNDLRAARAESILVRLRGMLRPKTQRVSGSPLPIEH